MKRSVFVLLIAAELLAVLCGCAGRVPETAQSAPPASASAVEDAEETRSAAVCMGSISHPVHRIVQLGFMEKAEELGYEGHILGLVEGTTQQLQNEWLLGAKKYDIDGAAFWVGDDASYGIIKELHGRGVKTVAMFPHDYWTAKDFIDVTVHSDWRQAVLDAGYDLMNRLHETDVLSGEIGFSLAGPGPTFDEIISLYSYLETYYPQYDILNCVYPGAEKESAANKVAEYITSHPNMVGAFGMTGYSAEAWASAKAETGREDIIVVAMDYTPENLEVLQDGGVDALICRPLYEEGAASMDLIDRLLNGQVFNQSEDTWWQRSQTYFIRRDGEGINGVDRYFDMYKRAEMRFGPLQ